jgi:D-threo-aldose 1-dehydrogenase
MDLGPLIFGGAPIGGLYAPVSDDAAAGTLAAAWAAGIRASKPRRTTVPLA